MDMYKLLVVSAALEAVWETFKMFWQGGKVVPDRVGPAIIGVFLCLVARVDLFDLVQLPLSIPYVGMALSGLLLSRGANFIHDFLTMIGSLKSLLVYKESISNK